MGQLAELADTLPLDFDDTLVEAPARPMSARRALAVWVGLSIGGWGLVAALIGYTTF
jgi:hypothetical protein